MTPGGFSTRQLVACVAAAFACCCVPFSVACGQAQPGVANPWLAPGIVAQQASAAGDSAREAVARRRARQLIAAMTLPQKLQQLTGSPPEILPELPHCFGARHVTGITSLNIPTFRITNGPVGVGQNENAAVSWTG